MVQEDYGIYPPEMNMAAIKQSSAAHHEEAMQTDIREKGNVSLGQDGTFEASVDDAHIANINEHESSLWEALRSWPGALMWSLVVSMSIIMEGKFDVVENSESV